MKPNDFDLQALIEDGLRAAPNSRWPELIVELFGLIEDHFRRRGLTEDAAATETQAMLLTLTVYLGGRRLYFPGIGRILLAEQRARAAAEIAAGKTREEVAAKYGFGRTKIYEIASGE